MLMKQMKLHFPSFREQLTWGWVEIVLPGNHLKEEFGKSRKHPQPPTHFAVYCHPGILFAVPPLAPGQSRHTRC